MLTIFKSDCWRFGTESSRLWSTMPLTSGAIGLKRVWCIICHKSRLWWVHLEASLPQNSAQFSNVNIFVRGNVATHLSWAPWNFFLQEWRFDPSRSSKVIDFGTNGQRVHDFLLLRHSNFGPGLQVLVLMTPRLFHPILGYSRRTRSPKLGLIWALILSYLAVKLFSKYPNLCDHGS